MLPILRIIPIGGVFLAALIVLLAISPPREAGRDVSPDMVLARGPLIDRREHPEWPQLLIKTAFRRADEILKLRDLPNTPTVVTPIPLPPVSPVTKVTVAPAQQIGLEPVKAEVVPPAPAVADTVVATLPSAVDDVKTASPAGAPVAHVQTPSAIPAPTASAPAVEPRATSNAEASPGPPTGDAAAMPLRPSPAAEPASKVAVLPLERPSTDPDRDEVTGTVSASTDATTIPVDIGETSSTELPIALPPERPSIQRERSSRNHHRAPRRTRASAKPPAPSNVQPASQMNLFEWLAQESNNRASPPKAPQGSKNGKTASATPAYPPTAFYPVTSP